MCSLSSLFAYLFVCSVNVSMCVSMCALFATWSRLLCLHSSWTTPKPKLNFIDNIGKLHSSWNVESRTISIQRFLLRRTSRIQYFTLSFKTTTIWLARCIVYVLQFVQVYYAKFFRLDPTFTLIFQVCFHSLLNICPFFYHLTFCFISNICKF